MRIVLIDEHPVFREGFAHAIGRNPGFMLAGSARNAREGFRLIDVHAPDVVVMDWLLPGMSGAAVVREIKRRRREAGVLVLSASCRERDVCEALAAGAHGYFSKADPADALIASIEAVARSERSLGPSVAWLTLLTDRIGVRDADDGGGDADVLAALSEREREVFDLVIRGYKNRAIARELCISIKTVDAHRLHVNNKLHCHSTVELVRFAVMNGLLSWGPQIEREDDGWGRSDSRPDVANNGHQLSFSRGWSGA